MDDEYSREFYNPARHEDSSDNPMQESEQQPTEGIPDVVTKDSVKRLLKSLPKQINVGAQSIHIKGTHEYRTRAVTLRKNGKFGPSYITIDVKAAEALVVTYSGTGELQYDKDGLWTRREKISTTMVIGVVVNNYNGVEQRTRNFKIHYADDGTHIVPDYDKELRGVKP